MGEWWEWLTDAQARRAHLAALRRKDPASRGLSAETMAAVQAGEIEIVDDGHPQVSDPPEDGD